MSDRRKVGIRRRLDNFGLRWQARLDGAWVDVGVPLVAAAVLFLLLLAMASASVRQLDGGPGLAVWRQAAWNFREHGAAYSQLGGMNPVRDQWSFIAWPLLVVTRWVPATGVFVTVQAAALAAAAIPLWRLARGTFTLRVGMSLALLVAYALAPATQAANLAVFHPEILAVPAFFAAFIAARRGRWLAYGIAVAVILSCRADLGMVVLGLGILLLSDGHRRAGPITIALGTMWTVAALVALHPELPQQGLTASQSFAAEGLASLGALRGLFLDPGTVIGSLFSRDATLLAVALFGPLLFLPMVAPRPLGPAAPVLIFGVAGAVAVQRAAEPGVVFGGGPISQVVVAVPFLFLAAMTAFARIGRPGVERILVDHRLVAALLLGALLVFIDAAPSSPYNQPWRWGGRDATDEARLVAARVVDDEATAASPSMLQVLAEQNRLVELPAGPTDFEAPPRWVDFVVLDTTTVGSNGVPLWADLDIARARRTLMAEGFRVVIGQQGILTFRRIT